MADPDNESTTYPIVTGVYCTLGTLLHQRQMTLAHLSEQVGVSVVNLSILKNNRAKAIRFSTLTAICAALECDIGDLLTIHPPHDKNQPISLQNSQQQ